MIAFDRAVVLLARVNDALRQAEIDLQAASTSEAMRRIAEQLSAALEADVAEAAEIDRMLSDAERRVLTHAIMAQTLTYLGTLGKIAKIIQAQLDTPC